VKSMRAVGIVDLGLLSLTALAVSIAALTAFRSVETVVLLTGALVTAVFVYLATFRFETLTMAMIATRTAIELAPPSISSGFFRLSVLATGAYTTAAVIWLIRNPARAGARLSPLAWATGAVAGAGAVSALLSPDPMQAGLGAARWVFLAVFVIVLERLITDIGGIRRLLYSVGLSLLVPLAVGVWQFIEAGPSVLDGTARLSGSLSHPNTYGFYLVVMILGLTAVARSLSMKPRLTVHILLTIAVVQLAATYSRTGYVALATGLVVLVVVGRRWLALSVIILAVAAVSLLPGIAIRWADIDQDVTLRGTPGNSLAWRIDYWGEVLAVSEERRVTGLGLGIVSDVTTEGREPHNDFIRAYAELGGLGLVAYLGLLVVLVRRAVLAVSQARPEAGGTELGRSLAVGFTAVTAAYLVGSVTGNLMTQLVLLWYVLTLAVAGGLIVRASRSSQPAPGTGRLNA
jgi:putative inorganic carbon (HCO3(-)) transporter